MCFVGAFKLTNGIGLVLFSAQYVVYLYGYLKEWRKNPHWSLSCCLAVFLPLLDLHGEISGLVGTNLVKTQLDTAVEMPTVFAAVKDSGAIDVTLEDDAQGDTKVMDVQDGNVSNEQYSNPRCHQGTQTEISWLAVANVSIEGTQQKSLGV